MSEAAAHQDMGLPISAVSWASSSCAPASAEVPPRFAEGSGSSAAAYAGTGAPAPPFLSAAGALKARPLGVSPTALDRSGSGATLGHREMLVVSNKHRWNVSKPEG